MNEERLWQELGILRRGICDDLGITEKDFEDNLTAIAEYLDRLRSLQRGEV